MTLIRKIYAGYVVAIVLLVAMLGLAIYDMNDTQSRYTSLLNEDVQVRYAASEMRFQIRDTVADMRAALLYRDRRAEFIKRTTDLLPPVDVAVTQMQAAAEASGIGVDSAAQIASKEVSWREGVTQVLAFLNSKNETAALGEAEKLAVPGQEIVDLSTQLIETANASVTAHTAAAEKASTESTIVIAAAAVLFIIFAIGLAVWIATSTKRTLREVTAKLMSSAAEMLAVSAQVAAGASQTATSISETTVTVVEVKQTAQLVNEKAMALVETANETTRVVEMGSKSVEETLSGIERMGEQMSVITESIMRLSDQTATISDVIATVNDLAEQSNLLSVNAAIEAAKAGDQGKGFAVVAQEVKNLADQSKMAVAQVRGVLAEIEKASTATIMATELGSKSVESTAKQSIQSGEAIDRLAESVAAAVLAIQQTAASTEQQFAGLDQIGSAMEAINEASAQNVAGTRQIEAEVGHLRDMANSLQALIDNRTAIGS